MGQCLSTTDTSVTNTQYPVLPDGHCCMKKCFNQNNTKQFECSYTDSLPWHYTNNHTIALKQVLSNNDIIKIIESYIPKLNIQHENVKFMKYIRSNIYDFEKCDNLCMRWLSQKERSKNILGDCVQLQQNGYIQTYLSVAVSGAFSRGIVQKFTFGDANSDGPNGIEVIEGNTVYIGNNIVCIEIIGSNMDEFYSARYSFFAQCDVLIICVDLRNSAQENMKNVLRTLQTAIRGKKERDDTSVLVVMIVGYKGVPWYNYKAPSYSDCVNFVEFRNDIKELGLPYIESNAHERDDALNNISFIFKCAIYETWVQTQSLCIDWDKIEKMINQNL